MWKVIIYFSFILVIPFFLVGCAKEEKEELTRIDVTMEEGKEIHIQDEFTLDLVKDALERIEWDSSIQMDKTSKEDFFVTFFYSIEENTPERIEEYRIWLLSEKAIIINDEGNTGTYKMKEDEVELMKNFFAK